MEEETASEHEGGESACFAHLICPECGAVLDDAGHSTRCLSGKPSLETVESAKGSSEPIA